MNKKRTLYRTLLILGLGLLALSLTLMLLLGDRLPDAAGGAMIGVSSGLAAMGLSNLLMLRQTEKDPHLARQMRSRKPMNGTSPSAAGPRPSPARPCSGR